MFDPQAFLDAIVDVPNEKRPPLPVENPDTSDGLYVAVIGEVKSTVGEKDGKPWAAMLVPLRIQVPASLQSGLKLQPELTLTDRVFLDLNDGGLIDNSPGRNRRQKAYRESADLNKPGDVFSWRKMEGKMVKIKLSHEDYQGSIQERVNGVLKAA